MNRQVINRYRECLLLLGEQGRTPNYWYCSSKLYPVCDCLTATTSLIPRFTREMHVALTLFTKIE